MFKNVLPPTLSLTLYDALNVTLRKLKLSLCSLLCYYQTNFKSFFLNVWNISQRNVKNNALFSKMLVINGRFYEKRSRGWYDNV